jgi:hypothetical protein
MLTQIRDYINDFLQEEPKSTPNSIRPGDRVVIIGGVGFEKYKDSVGVAFEHASASDAGFIGIEWLDSICRGYHISNVVKISMKEDASMSERAIPTKLQVLEAAERCPQSKETLQILFPEDFLEQEIPLGLSQDGKYLVWYHADDGDYYVFALAGGAVLNEHDGTYTFCASSLIDMKQLRKQLKELNILP